MSLRNTNFENWRLSRIEEEMERLSYSSQDTSADDGSCSPRSAEGTLERGRCAKGPGIPGKDDGIYSSTALGTNAQGNISKEEENSKDALRFIKEKYDSLGKVKVKKPCVESVEAHHVTSVSGSDECLQRPEPEEPQALAKRSPERRARDCDDGKTVTELDLGSCRLSPAQSARKSSAAISEQELTQVEMFYRSHKTSVFVCLCQASLYLSDPIRNSLCPIRTDTAQQDASRPDQPSPSQPPVNWTLVKSGIPVLVLDSGESRRQRRLNLILAERGTGFGLWRDQIDCLSNYEAPAIAFHTMNLSNDHSKLIGLRFEDPASAADFLQHVLRLTSDSDDPLLSLASSADDRKAKKAKKTEAKRQQKGKGTTVTKADISQPCCFTHITKLDRCDGSNLLRGQTTDYSAINSPRPGSGSGDRHNKVKLKP